MELEIMLSEIATPTDKDHKFFSFVEARWKQNQARNPMLWK
jgi:hypothetical protein